MDSAAPAKLLYDHGQFKVLWPGSYVICAATGQRIALEDLRYWSVDRQEPYVSPEAALKRAAEVAGA
ncbi:DUF2093 domain-containing protein [Zavarzinia compransoris]|uniref:DUF2093 domain-containing protein n=1 Tax=Zavarzinia marina TaxID=2911065 RepID=UPI001F3E49D3|nr:DUF2093 domain-containing protein [Zavarzinia marina]MCF4164742.1 DUF2093 domain-containing protein [Zavarzinia marina]